MLQDDGKRQALVAGLEAIAGPPPAAAGPAAAATTAAAPVAPAAVPPAAPAGTAGGEVAPTPAPAPAGGEPGAPAPTAGAAPAAPAAPKPSSPLVAGGLGDQIVAASAGWFEALTAEVDASMRAVTGFPALVRWVRQSTADPLIRQRTMDAAAKCGIILGAALVVQLAVAWPLRRLRRRLDAQADARDAAPSVDETVLPEAHPRVRAARAIAVLRRLPGAVLHALLGFLPALAFFATAYATVRAGTVTLFTTKMIVLQIIHTYLIFWAVVAAARLLFTARHARWRLIDLGDRAAGFLGPWVGWLTAVALLGGALASIGGRLGLSEPAQEGFIKLSALGVHIGLIVLVWRARRPVARKLRPRAGLSQIWTGLATTYAEGWHWGATALLVASWGIWAIQRQRGFERALTLFGVTVLIVAATRLLITLAQAALDRAFHAPAAGSGDTTATRSAWSRRAMRYYPFLRRFISFGFVVAGGLTMMEAWGYHALGWFSAGAVGARLIAAFGTILVILFVSLLVWEAANIGIDSHLQALSAAGHFTRAGRLRTLAPLLRTCLFGLILVVVCLTALSELGVNTGPLLAGAGIFGVALGFGSQKLVQDFITGIFLLLENAMQVGEWVTVSGLSGTVENLSVRTLRLRAGDGSVHVIPFSSVTTVTNTNRGIGNAAVSVTVSILEDVDAVGEVLKKIATEMRADPDYRSGIRADLALWGVDRVDASTVTLVGQIECTDAARWGVQREFNRRVKKRFQELGIRLANPAQPFLVEELPRLSPARGVPLFGVPGEPPAAERTTDPGESAASTTRSPPPAALGNTH